jgi:cytochrome c-type biogenesis protein CcmH
MKHVLFIVILFGLSPALMAAQETRPKNSPPAPGDTLITVSREQVQKIAHKLMAPCCWSGTVDEHQSPAADEIKKQIRTALQQGYTEQEILDGFVAAYGERILAKPKAVGFNLLVWILPVVAMVIGGFVAWRYLSRVRVKTVTKSRQTEPSREEDYEQRLERELKEFDN